MTLNFLAVSGGDLGGVVDGAHSACSGGKCLAVKVLLGSPWPFQRSLQGQFICS